MPLPTEQTDFVRSHLLPEDTTAQGYWAQRGRAGLTGLARDQGVSHRSKVKVPGTRLFDRRLNTSLRSHAFMQDDADLSPYASVLLQREEAKAKACAAAAAQEIRRAHVPASPLATAPDSTPQLIPPYNTEFILSAPSPRLSLAAAPSTWPAAQDAAFSDRPGDADNGPAPAPCVTTRPSPAVLPARTCASASQHTSLPDHAFPDRPPASDVYPASNRTSSCRGLQDAGVFAPGDRLATGTLHDGSVVQAIDSVPGDVDRACATGREFEVVRKLSQGKGECLYLVKNVEVNHASKTGEDSNHLILRCLCKRKLTAEMLSVQRLSATLHQSLPMHDNVVTLHCAYETPDWLFLVHEYYPGQDLFYWLEQAQDVLEGRQHDENAASELAPAGPSHCDLSLLATTSGFSILSWDRLCLISSLFQQICSAVQFCHDCGIAHRDLKPENFVVGHCSVPLSETADISPVTVKLASLSHATKKKRRTDPDCGSRPYMSYECCNDTETSHDPKLADVWGLGVILLNMLFHRNPFHEASAERCASFAAFEQNPVGFLTSAFDGLTITVASYLSAHVFNRVPTGGRVSAAELGAWSADLCQHLGLGGPEQRPIFSRGASMGITSPMSRVHLVHTCLRSCPVHPTLAPLAEQFSLTSHMNVHSGVRITPDTLSLALEEVQIRRNVSPARLSKPAFPLHETTSSLSARRGTGNALTVMTSRQEPSGTLRSLDPHEEVVDSSDDEVASVASSAKPRRRKRGNRKGSVASRAREAAQQSEATASPLLTPNTPSLAAGAEKFRKPALPAKPMMPSEHLVSWRDRKASISEATSRTSMSSVRTAESDDTMSVHSTASAPAGFIRRSHESALKPPGSTMRLQPISEQPAKAKPSSSQLDASFLAEMFGGPPRARTQPDRRRRPKGSSASPLALHGQERAHHSMDHVRPPIHASAHPKRQPHGPPIDSASASFSIRSTRDSASLSNGSSLSAAAVSDRSAGDSVRSTPTPTPTPSTSGEGSSANGKKSGLTGKGFSKLFRK